MTRAQPVHVATPHRAVAAGGRAGARRRRLRRGLLLLLRGEPRAARGGGGGGDHVLTARGPGAAPRRRRRLPGWRRLRDVRATSGRKPFAHGVGAARPRPPGAHLCGVRRPAVLRAPPAHQRRQRARDGVAGPVRHRARGRSAPQRLPRAAPRHRQHPRRRRHHPARPRVPLRTRCSPAPRRVRTRTPCTTSRASRSVPRDGARRPSSPRSCTSTSARTRASPSRLVTAARAGARRRRLQEAVS